MGSKGGSTQQTTSSSGPPPQVLAEYQSLVDRAANVANQPYQPYQGEQVAPLAQQTLQGLGGINQYANTAQPYLGAAGAMTMGASAPVNPSQFEGMGSLAPFMNPYTASVVGTTQAEMNNQNQQQAQFLNSANISSGAFGGDRAGIGQAILANQQQLAEAPTIAGLNQANYTQAMQNWAGQQGVNLAAQQANAARQLSGAAQLGQIGVTGQTEGLQGAQADIQAGMIPQNEQQQIDQAAQNMYQTGQAYPFTTTGWLGNIIEGTGGASGGTSQTTAPGPNTAGQMIGAGMQGLGMLGSLFGLSDVRAKENVEPIGKTYDGQNIYRYNFKGDPRTQIGLLAQEEAYHDPGSVQRIGMGDLLGIDYEGATDEAAERGHFQEGGAAQPPPGGMTQGVTQQGGGAAPQSQPSRALSPDLALMYMGAPGARMGMGSLGLMGGTNIRPQPETALGRPTAAPTMQPQFGAVDIGSGLGGLGGQRQSFQGGGVALPPGVIPIGTGSSTSYSEGWHPGTLLNSQAGVSEALFGELSAGSKNPYTGIDVDQAGAIGGGEWLPPQPATGFPAAPQPDYQNLQKSPQFGSAEASLAGQFGSPSTGVAPSVGGPMTSTPAIGGALIPGGAGATAGGLSRDQLGDIANQYFGGGAGSGAGAGGSGGGFGYTPGSTPFQTAKPAAAAPAAAPAARPMMMAPAAAPVSLHPSLGGEASVSNLMSMAGGGGVNMNGRSGFQRGGFPQFTTYQPTANPARNPPTYTALDLSHMLGGGQQPQAQVPPAIAMQRHLQGQARAKAAVQRGIVRPRVIAPDPVTGQHHDITPPSLHDRPPFGTGPYNPGDPQSDPSLHGPLTRMPPLAPPGVAQPRAPLPGPREPAPVNPRTGEIIPPSRGPGMGYPTLGLLPEEAPGTPDEVSGRVFQSGMPQRTVHPLEGEQEWHRPSTNIQEPIDSSEFSEHTGGRPLMAPRLVGADPYGQSHRLLGGHDPALFAPSGDEAPMFTGDDMEMPGIFHGGGRGFQTEAQGGRVARWGGGRLGFQGGGAADDVQDPSILAHQTEAGMPASDLSDADFARGLRGEMQTASPSDLGWLSDKSLSGPSASDWNALTRGASQPDRTGYLQMRPDAVARAPTFGGGGGGGPHFTTTSLMGGPPITALDLSGHYTPTTGNARGPATYVPGVGGGAGAGVNPNARAQAPEHPAITTMRHIVRTHDARRQAAPQPNWNYGPLQQGNIWQGSGGPHNINRNWIPPSEDYLGGANTPGFQGGGGVMGSSPLMNAGGYTPQGAGLTGMTSQGQGLGSIATAKGASGGFGDMFGGGERAGFAEGGGSGVDPFLAAITSSSPQTSGGGGHGPPQPPEPPKPPSQGGDQPGSPGDIMGKLGSAVKGLKGSPGQQTQPTGADGSLSPADQANLPTYSAADQSAMDAATSGDLFAGALDPANFADSQFFQTGGGVGLGALRGNFQAGGDAADAPSGFDLAVTGNAPPVAQGGGGGGGGGAPAVPDLIKQNFGERAGYASTISRLESGMGSSYVGDGGSSFGPFQLHYGGVNKDMPHPGLGDEFTKQTGLDARDPKTVPAQVKFVADYTAKHGWNDWSTKGRADKIAGGANVPSQGAMPASASTESYGGGFAIPPGQGGPPPGQLDRSNLQAPTMGDELRHDPAGYMMTVGAAMMASRSPWLGTSIGEGFVAGNKYLDQQKELEKSWGQTQANINNLSAEAREHGADADLKVQQLQYGAQMNQLNLEWMRQKMKFAGQFFGGDTSGATGGQGDGSGAIAPIAPIGSGTGAAGAPGAGAEPSGGAGSGTVVAAGAAGAGAGAGAAGAGAMPDLAKDPDFIRGQALIAQGNRKNAQGGVFGVKDAGADLIARGNALVEGAKSRYTAQSGPILKGQEEEAGANVKATTEQDASVREGIGQRAVVAQRAQALLDILDSGYKPGAGADWKADVIRYIKSAGFNPAAIGLDPSTAANYQEFMKNATNMVMDSVKAMPGTPRVAEITAYTKASPNAELEPEANRAILAQALGVMDYQDQYGQGYLKWRHGPGAHPTTLALGDYDDQYAHDPKFKGDPVKKIQDFVDRRRARTGVRPPGLPSGKYSYDNQSGVWTNKATGKAYNYDGSPVQ